MKMCHVPTQRIGTIDSHSGVDYVSTWERNQATGNAPREYIKPPLILSVCRTKSNESSKYRIQQRVSAITQMELLIGVHVIRFQSLSK